MNKNENSGPDGKNVYWLFKHKTSFYQQLSGKPISAAHYDERKRIYETQHPLWWRRRKWVVKVPTHYIMKQCFNRFYRA